MSDAPDTAAVAPRIDRRILEELYDKLTRREFVHPDPLEFLYRYDDTGDREIVGLVASSLAYGRVKQILASVENALDRMGPKPASYLVESTPESLRRSFDGFKHRFTTGEDLCRMLDGARSIVREHGSLGALFSTLVGDEDETVLPALTSFVSAVGESSCDVAPGPLPAPERGSACKRLHLFLRWMVRRDAVDPGGWDGVSPSKLVVPLDTHMHRISQAIGLTSRKQADVRTALEITRGFRAFSPNDPVKYDFAITRLGIRDDLSAESLAFVRAAAAAS